MKKSDASIVTIVGMRGCGKSTLTQQIAKQSKYNRKVVFDMVQEWNGAFLYANSYDEFANLWRENFHKKHFTIIIRYVFGIDAHEIIETQTRITKLIYLTGRDSEVETVLIFEEAQFYFPNMGLHPVNMHLLTTGRHAFINIIANTQRPASISKLLISQSQEIYIGQLYEMNDIKYLYETVGELALEARSLQQLEFIYYPIGKHEQIKIITL